MTATSHINEIEQNVHEITFNDGKTLYLIGTAHVSQHSVDLVERIIDTYQPDTISIELDEARHKAVTEKNRYENINVLDIIKKKQLFFFIGQFILASFQKKMSEKTKTKPGSEFIKAAEIAGERNIRLVLADRSLGTTLKRAWRKTPFIKKLKLLFSLIMSDDDPIESRDIEELKKSNAIDEMIKMFAEHLPEAKTALIDERDSFLAYEISKNLGETTVAVVGAGHVPGMLKQLHSPISKSERAAIDTVPPATIVDKALPWIIPAIILTIFTLGFFFGKKEVALDVLGFWVLANGTLTAIGCLIAFANPLTVLAGFLAAPITSLNPTIGAGFVTALVQAVVCKPRVRDFEEVQEGTIPVLRWWKNRLTKIFLVFILSSVGSSIGTFVAAPYLMKFFNG